MDLLKSIGNTDLIELKMGQGQVFAKLEKQNPGGSIKDRPALYMIEEALATGALKKGMTIIEPTSGNMGIALAMIGRHYGFPVELVMPESMSVERRELMISLGAKLRLTGEGGMEASVRLAQDLAQEDHYFMPSQFDNPANKRAHFETTGPEIIEALPNLVGFIAGIGTGGTISGVAEAMESRGKEVAIWGIEPKESALLTTGQAKPHQIQGIGANFVPSILRQDLIDKILPIEGEKAVEMTRRLAQEEGLLVGISSGANVLGALEMAKELGGPIVTVLPDASERYLSTPLFNHDY